MTVDLSVGAIGAAVIAGLVSLIGLIISKEQKTSEFRQAWIDDLRKEIVTFTTNINGIADALTAGFSSQQEKVKALSPLYSTLNSSVFAIRLRLNPEEDLSRAVLSSLGRFYSLAGDESKIKPANIRPIEKDLLDSSAELLKVEWVRVKQGEKTFRYTKKLLVLFLMVATVLLILAVLFGDVGRASEIHKPASITNVVSKSANVSELCADAAERNPDAVSPNTRAAQGARSISRKTMRRSSSPKKLQSLKTGNSLKCPIPAVK